VESDEKEGSVLITATRRSARDEKRTDDKTGKVTFHRVERGEGATSRVVRLPDSASVADVKAALDKGVLTITVPKKAGSATRRKTVAIDDEPHTATT
jgi:HSP20 family protein